MSRPDWTRQVLYSLSVALVGAVLWAMTSPAVCAGQEAQPSASQQSDQSAGQSQKQEKPKKKGGIFGGLKAITGSSNEQTADTASAGTKGVGEGEKIADVTPTAADRQAVTGMENYSVPQGDLKKFIVDGNLKPK